MATARALLVDPDHPMHYHIVSRCVRQSWLCGWDRVRRKDYSHRKQALKERLFRLVKCFAVELHGFAIMSNHFHLVLRYDPCACHRWTRVEVAERWVAATAHKHVLDDTRQVRARVTAISSDPETVQRLRHRLGSLSAFMQQLKQPVARNANLEDGVTGHFFDNRFYSGALLSEQALLAAMAYVDLNPVRAGIAKDIEECDYTSIEERLRDNSADRLEQLLGPLASGLKSDEGHSLGHISLVTYTNSLRAIVRLTQTTKPNNHDIGSARVRRWARHVATLSRRQRAFGKVEQLSAWLKQRNMRILETAFN